DAPAVTVMGEQHGRRFGEELLEVEVVHSVRVLAWAHENGKVDHVNDADFDSGQIFLKPPGGGHRFESGYVADAGEDDVRVAAVIAREFPDGFASRAVLDSFFHRELL